MPLTLNQYWSVFLENTHFPYELRFEQKSLAKTIVTILARLQDALGVLRLLVYDTNQWNNINNELFDFYVDNYGSKLFPEENECCRNTQSKDIVFFF